MWATRESGEPERLHRTKADAAAWDYAGGYDARADSVYRVAVIPLSDTEAIVERVAKAIDPDAWTMCDTFERRMNAGDPAPWYDHRQENRDKARRALTAAGIPCRKARK